MERDFSGNKVQACFQFQHHDRAAAEAGKMPNVFILAQQGVSSVFCLQKKANAHVSALPSMRASESVASPLSGGDRGCCSEGHRIEDALVGQDLGDRHLLNGHLCGQGCEFSVSSCYAAPKDSAATLNQAETRDAQADKLCLSQLKKSSSLPAAGNGLQTFSWVEETQRSCSKM